MKTVKVVGAIIENEQQEILCALRSPHMVLPNQWEFPGGKVEPGETFSQAIEREIHEELETTVKSTELFHQTVHQYDDVIVDLITVKCTLLGKAPIAKEHSTLIWLKRENLASLNWAPADYPAVEKLILENTPPANLG